jgi:hypothetical protein
MWKETSSPPQSLLLGIEASQSCPALLPLAWNVNKPAGETKTQLSAFQGPSSWQQRLEASGQLTVHVHHPWGGAILWSGHL